MKSWHLVWKSHPCRASDADWSPALVASALGLKLIFCILEYHPILAFGWGQMWYLFTIWYSLSHGIKSSLTGDGFDGLRGLFTTWSINQGRASKHKLLNQECTGILWLLALRKPNCINRASSQQPTRPAVYSNSSQYLHQELFVVFSSIHWKILGVNIYSNQSHTGLTQFQCLT